jgi:hypothetical protein
MQLQNRHIYYSHDNSFGLNNNNFLYLKPYRLNFLNAVKELAASSVKHLYYSARRLIGSRIIESAAYCDQKLLAHLYLRGHSNNT